jgi:hypothetical protein
MPCERSQLSLQGLVFVFFVSFVFQGLGLDVGAPSARGEPSGNAASHSLKIRAVHPRQTAGSSFA